MFTSKLRSFQKRFIPKFNIVIRLITSLIIIISIVAISVASELDKSYASPIVQYEISIPEKEYILLPEIRLSDIELANSRKAVEIEKKIAEENRLKEREAKIQRAISFLRKQKSPVANYEIASIIVDKSAANGADFRVVIAIMGTESGFCKASFSYNCFGYLNGAKYASFVHAFNDLVPKVSRQYAAKYGWNFEAMAKAYGMKNWEYHSANMRGWASAI